MEVAIDKQGRIIIPKEVRERYGLTGEARLELVPREDVIELFPLPEEGDMAIRHLAEPCQTGDQRTRHKAFNRERAWTR